MESKLDTPVSGKRELEPEPDSFTSANESNHGRSKNRRLNMLTKRNQQQPTPPREPHQSSNHPDYCPSGLLDANNVEEKVSDGEYTEPDDSCTDGKFRFYMFEDHDDIKDTISLNQKSKYTVGSAKDADICIEGVSAAHAVIQIRRPKNCDTARIYIVDLHSTDGSTLNGHRIEPMRFVELVDKDTLKFGPCANEFLLIEDSN